MNEKQKKENRVIFIGIGTIILIIFLTIGKSYWKNNNSPPSKVTPINIPYEDYNFITAKELNDKIIAREELNLIDIRDGISFDKFHIEQSINVLPENLNDALFSTLDKNKLTIVIGYNFEDKIISADAIKTIKQSGFKDVMALSGGMVGWAQEGNQIISGGDKDSVLDWSKINYIIAEQLKLAIDNNYPVFILDTRATFQYSAGHIPKSVNIPLAQLEDRKSEIPPTKEILVYGATTDDDFKSSVKLHDLGFLATYTLEGGLNAWKEKKFEIEK